MTNIVSNIASAISRRFKKLLRRKPKLVSVESPFKPTTTQPYLPPPPEEVEQAQSSPTTLKSIPDVKPSRWPQIPHFRVPHLLAFKRGIAAVLVVFNGLMSQFVLGWGRDAQAFALIFLGNAFIMIDYLWKTRKGEAPFKKKKKESEE